MNRKSRIFVAGARGLAGSALVRALEREGFERLLVPEIDRLDLTDQSAVESFFRSEAPEYVILAAARVGGIHANNSFPAEFIHINLAIQNNVIHCAWKSGVKRLLFLGSSCIYPKLAPQPLKEEYLLSGPLEPTNEPYAIAKIAGIKMCEAYNRQYGTEFFAVMPTNMYGPGDNFHYEQSHVLPALIRRFHEAKENRDGKVVVWGTGTPRRELLHVDDMASAALFLLQLPTATLGQELLSYPKPCFLNIGTGVDASIAEIAALVRDATGFGGDIVYDTSKPDGTPQKLQDISRISALGWRAAIPLKEGIRMTYDWFLANMDSYRK